MPSAVQVQQERDLPVISLNRLRDPQTSEAEVAHLVQVCETCGFFYLSDHGVPIPLLRRVKEASRAFFELPEEIKREYGQDKHEVKPSTCRGYAVTENVGIQIVDSKQVFDMGIERPKSERPFTGQNILPPDSVAPGFASAMLEMQKQVMENIVPLIARSLGKGVAKDETFFDKALHEPTLIQRAVHYPAGNGSAGKHTDSGLFTVLIQEPSEHRSLQVFTGGEWIGAEACEEMFVINIGDALQYWTDNRFVSTPHQVIHKGEASRLSFPFFVYPNIDFEFEALGSGNRVSIEKLMLGNFDNIWNLGKGGGRAQELS